MLALPLLFLAIFFYLPLLTTFRMAWVSAREPAFSTADLATIWRSLSFTFYQATLSTALTLLVGLPAAYLFSRYLFRGKRLLRALVMVPFILPTVVVAAGFNALLGPRGWLNLALMSLFNLSTPPIDLIYTLAAILLAHLFYNTSVIIRLVGSAWSRLDIQLEQAGKVLGAGRLQVFRKITLPLLKPAILSASLLVFLFDFTSFGVILLLGGPKYATVEVSIYLQSMQFLNFPLAAVLSVIQLACTFTLITLVSRLTGQTVTPIAPALKEEGMAHPRSRLEKGFVGLMGSTLFVVFLSPLLALALRSVTSLEANPVSGGGFQTAWTGAYYQELFINRRGSLFYVPPVEAMRNSLVYAGVAVLITLVLGMLITAALERRNQRGSYHRRAGHPAAGGIGGIARIGLAAPFQRNDRGGAVGHPARADRAQRGGVAFFHAHGPAGACFHTARAQGIRGGAGCFWRAHLAGDHPADPLATDPGGDAFRLHDLTWGIRGDVVPGSPGIPDPADRHFALPYRAGSPQLRTGDGHVHPADAGLCRVRVRDRFVGVTAQPRPSLGRDAACCVSTIIESVFVSAGMCPPYIYYSIIQPSTFQPNIFLLFTTRGL